MALASSERQPVDAHCQGSMPCTLKLTWKKWFSKKLVYHHASSMAYSIFSLRVAFEILMLSCKVQICCGAVPTRSHCGPNLSQLYNPNRLLFKICSFALHFMTSMNNLNHGLLQSSVLHGRPLP